MITVRVRIFPVGREPVTLAVKDDINCINLDDVFAATNRVDEYTMDLYRLPHRWQHELRRQLETAPCPSMSTGDEVHFVDEHGDVLGRFRCEPLGWSLGVASQWVEWDDTDIWVSFDEPAGKPF